MELESNHETFFEQTQIPQAYDPAHSSPAPEAHDLEIEKVMVVHQIISMIKRIWTSRLSIQNCLSHDLILTCDGQIPERGTMLLDADAAMQFLTHNLRYLFPFLFPHNLRYLPPFVPPHNLRYFLISFIFFSPRIHGASQNLRYFFAFVSLSFLRCKSVLLFVHAFQK